MLTYNKNLSEETAVRYTHTTLFSWLTLKRNLCTAEMVFSCCFATQTSAYGNASSPSTEEDEEEDAQHNTIQTSCAGGRHNMPHPGLYRCCSGITLSSYLFARYHLFRHVGYLRHQKVVSESRVMSATSVPIFVFIGLSVLDLGLMYATRQTSDSIIA